MNINSWKLFPEVKISFLAPLVAWSRIKITVNYSQLQSIRVNINNCKLYSKMYIYYWETLKLLIKTDYRWLLLITVHINSCKWFLEDYISYCATLLFLNINLLSSYKWFLEYYISNLTTLVFSSRFKMIDYSFLYLITADYSEDYQMEIFSWGLHIQLSNFGFVM